MLLAANGKVEEDEDQDDDDDDVDINTILKQ